MRNKVFLLIKIIVSSSLIYYLLSKIGIQTLLNEIATAHFPWVISGIFIFTISNFLGSFQWHLLLRQSGVRLTYFQVLKIYYIGLFFNNFFISNMGGDFFRFFYVNRAAKNSSSAISTVFLDRFLGFTMLTIFAIGGGIYWIGTIGIKNILPVLLILLSFWVAMMLVFMNRKLGRLVHFLLKWFMPEKLLNKLKDIYNLIHDFSRNKRLVSTVLLISFVIQFVRVFTHYIAGKAIGVQTDFVPFLIFIPLIALLASLPISIGGLGVREQTGVLLFKSVGVTMALAISMEFLAYLINIVCSLPGLFFFIFAGGWRKIDETD